MMEELQIDMTIQNMAQEADDLSKADLSPEQMDALAASMLVLAKVLYGHAMRAAIQHAMYYPERN